VKGQALEETIVGLSGIARRLLLNLAKHRRKQAGRLFAAGKMILAAIARVFPLNPQDSKDHDRCQPKEYCTGLTHGPISPQDHDSITVLDVRESY
jgi:hypothetical protein